MSASLLGLCLALYAVAGTGIGLLFVTKGAGRVHPGASFSRGARVMIFPGAAVLWPYVLYCWLKRGKSS